MKKTLVSALTTALVVGAASTTFAAANPFSDVPADHWAYDAVSQLAADGVIEGYGDSTFRGDRNITRYEMAQMVARAMAKNDVSAANKAMIDKLAAEFADELNNLGVRVSNLERNADMVKWNGKLEYTYQHDKRKVNGNSTKAKTDNLLFRLEPSAEVNEHWHVNARIDGNFDMSEDRGGSGDSDDRDFRLRRAWAQGDYKNFSVRFGKFAMYDDDSITDETMSGADLKIGNDNKLSGIVGGGSSRDVFDGGILGDNTQENDYKDVDNTKKTNAFYVGLDYNRAQNIEDEYYSKKKFEEGDRQATVMYEKALPYYEAAFSFDSERKDKGIGIALRQLYGRRIAKVGKTSAEGKELTAKRQEVCAAYELEQ